jgi:drug/metabolite transporter (DMT)-like permease
VSITGVAVGFMGAFVLIAFQSSASIHAEGMWAILPVAATFCYGLSGNIVKTKLYAQNSLYITAIAMLFVGTPCLLFSAPMVFSKLQNNPNTFQALAYIFILSVFGTFIAWMLYYQLVQKTDALFASSVTYVIPVVATAWGIADGEWIGIQHVVGLILILMGVWLVSKGNKIY